MSMNRVFLLGRLGGDPELRNTTSGTAVCNLNLATTERVKDKEPQTEWHRVVVFGKTAEFCAKYLSKGRECLVEGRIQTRKWTDKNGEDKQTTEIVANDVRFVGSAPERTATPATKAGSPIFDDNIPF